MLPGLMVLQTSRRRYKGIAARLFTLNATSSGCQVFIAAFSSRQMPEITSYSVEILKVRHGLSSRQVNSVFGREVAEEGVDEKIAALEKIARFIKITNSLASEGIEFVPLKGPLLSFRIYDDATVREFCDLDIMVGIQDIRRAGDLLISLGYEPVGYRLPGKEPGRQIVLRHVHHILFTNRDHSLRVELHWRLFQTPTVRAGRLEELIAGNTTEVTFEGRPFRVLSGEIELLYLVMHGSIHYWKRLKWLIDIHEYLQKNAIDWGKFKSLALEFKASRLISLANFVLGECFPSGPFIPWDNDKIPFMRSYALDQINKVDEPDHETLKAKLCRLRFSFNCFPGILYKVRRVQSAACFYIFMLVRGRKSSYDN